MKFVTATLLNGQTGLVAVPHILAITADRTTQGSKLAMSSYGNGGMAVKESPVQLARDLREAGKTLITVKVQDSAIAYVAAEHIQAVVPEVESRGSWIAITGHSNGGISSLQKPERIHRAIQEAWSST